MDKIVNQRNEQEINNSRKIINTIPKYEGVQVETTVIMREYAQIDSIQDRIGMFYWNKWKKEEDVSEASKGGYENKWYKPDEKYNSFKNNITRTMARQYIEDEEIEGVIGTGEPEDQETGIVKMCRLASAYNTLAKDYKAKARVLKANIRKKKYLNKDEEKADMEELKNLIGNKERCYIRKDQIMSDLLACIYILEKTGGEEYKNKYCYGHSIDQKGHRLSIDLPYTGQFSMHFGNKYEAIVEEAKEKAKTILDKKLEYEEEIDEDKLDEDKINELKKMTDEIPPDYSGCYFEKKSNIIIELTAKHVAQKRKKFGIEDLHSTIENLHYEEKEIGEDIIIQLMKRGLNYREIYTYAIINGWKKSELELIANMVEKDKSKQEAAKKIDTKKMGRNCVKATTPRERREQQRRREQERQRANNNRRSR